MRAIIVLTAIIAFLSLGVWWQVYRWEDCRMVGHSTLYCIMTIGK
jgi:hypothetical protein